MIYLLLLALCETLRSLNNVTLLIQINLNAQMGKPTTSNEKTRLAARVMKSLQEAPLPPQNFPESLSTQDALPLDWEFATF